MQKLDSCGFVRLPKVSSPAHSKVNDLFILIYSFFFSWEKTKQILMHYLIIPVLTVCVVGWGMYGSALWKAEKGTEHFETEKKYKEKFSELVLKWGWTVYLLALAQELPVSEISVTQMYKWDECATFGCAKGSPILFVLVIYIILSWLTCS